MRGESTRPLRAERGGLPDLWSAPPPFLIAVAVFAGMSGVACGAVDFAVYAFWEKRSPRELLALKRKGGSDVN